MIVKKKLIEVALPLDAINTASAREKSIRHGHPSTLHLWWARRPLAAARAVIFSQMVDDPSEYVEQLLEDPKKKRPAKALLKHQLEVWEKTRQAQLEGGATPGEEPTLESAVAEVERERLFKIIEELVKWENNTNEEVLQQARDEIWQSWRRTCAENVDHPRAKELFDRHKLPAFHDPFAGGGALPLEAQRLGLEAYASDLNPVAVLINKAMIEIPPQFAGQPPVNPEVRESEELFEKQWRGAEGLAEDVRYYGNWMRGEAEKRIGHLYPRIEVTAEMARDPEGPRPDLEAYVGKKLTVIAWIWTRTVKSPNPAFADVDVPLASTFMLSTKKGKEAYVEPVIEGKVYRFRAKAGAPRDLKVSKHGTKVDRRANFSCVMSGAPIDPKYIRSESRAGRLGSRLMAIVAQGERERVFLAPTAEMEAVAHEADPEWEPDVEFFERALGFRIGNYGLTKWSDLFSPRQTQALGVFSDLVHEVQEEVRQAAIAGGSGEGEALADGGNGAAAYASAVAVYLACAISRACDYWNCNATWESGGCFIAHAFTRQAIPMVWDFAEANPFSEASGNWMATCLGWVERVVRTFSAPQRGEAVLADAQTQVVSVNKIISTDPPYYDNVGYADLSDFFYIWLRRSLKDVFPGLFSTLAVPKAEELVATPARHGGRKEAEDFFLSGMTQAMHRLAEQAHSAFPVTIYYAFKQSEVDQEGGTASTGWETFLGAVIAAGFAVLSTWPLRTERAARSRGIGSNALASSILLACRQRSPDAPSATRREFTSALREELPEALLHLQRGNIAPVDLAQAAIGPGMAAYSRYSSVLDAEGKPISVREALRLINQILDEVLAEQEGDFDADTRWALAWFEQEGFEEGEYGLAETLSKAKNTSVEGMVEAGILASRGGKVRLLRPDELPEDWDPDQDSRLTVWEMVHHLARVLESRGESESAELAAKLGSQAEIARELAYRLYALCERQGRAAQAMTYNGLVQSWPEIRSLARAVAASDPEQQEIYW